MSFGKHINVLDYTLQSLLRRKFKNAGIILVFTFVIFILGSILFLAYSFKREAVLILENSPELIVQRTTAGRHELIPTDMAGAIEKIPGVSRVEPRYWGYYYDSLVGANYTVLSAGGSISQTNRIVKGRVPGPGEKGSAAVGSGVARARFVGIDDELTMLSSSGAPMDLRVVGIFDTASELLASDLIVIGHEDFTDLFRPPPGMATDLVVSVPHESEAPVIAKKIHDRFPDTRPILRREIIRTYDAVFGWRSGLVLTVFTGALVAFIILAWDKATGLSAEEKREIGILKALGWETSDILEMKFWEGLTVSLSLASTIIPSWKAAITDPDEVVRG
ncbi:MAG: ABC transporter permease [Candidatus Sulfobium sp.]